MARFQHRKSIQRLLSQLTPRVSSFPEVNKWGASLIRVLTGLDDIATVFARVTKAADQAIPDTTATSLVFDTVRWDNGGLYTSGATSRLTAPVSGVYALGVNVEWEANAVGTRTLSLLYNGVDLIASVRASPAAAGVTRQALVTEWPLNETDYVEARVVQTSGGPLNVVKADKYSPEFWIHWKDPLQE